MLFNKKHWNKRIILKRKLLSLQLDKNLPGQYMHVLKNRSVYTGNFINGLSGILFLLFVLIPVSCASNRSIPSFCVISTPNITLTGEKTSIERQIIGEYNELEEDAWIISSVDTNLQQGQGISVESGDPDLLAAMKIRAFHEDRIRDYKEEGALGEGNDGFISYLKSNKYERNKDLKNILNNVKDEENKARRVIFIKSMQKSGIQNPDDKDILEFGKIFAEEQRALALKNHWIQETSGKWVQKK